MTDIRNKILKKINQGGSMMVEAMAMLALIALVTPTLYKKSAERTTELQDINTASHIRTLSKAVDNYVATNYQALLAGELSEADSKKTIDLKETSFTQFLPYGYSFDNLKNFGVPKVVVKRQGDSASVTAFVQLPKKTDIGEMRAARIASMVGSNGGYVNADKEAKGVGGVWSLDTSGLTDLGFDDTHGSVVVASSEAINSATSGALENEKYLQRTPVKNEADLWRNTMTTDLYMGGLPGDGDTSVMHQILGVEKMIIGATVDGDEDDDDRASGLLIAGGKSAWIDGSLTALGDFFNVYYEGGDRVLLFGETPGSEQGDGTPIKAVSAPNKSQVNLVDNAVELINDAFGGEGGRKATASFYMDEFTVGKRGGDKYIYADNGKTELHKGELKVATDAAGKGYTSAKTKLYVGMEESEKVAKTPWLSRTDHTLEVKGNAYISDNLEVHNKMVSQATDTGKLRAGRHGNFSEGPNVNNYDDNYWLVVDQNDGVQIRDKSTGYENGFPKSQRFLVDNDETKLFGVGRVSKVDLGATNAILQGGDAVDIYTTDADGVVSIQDGAIEAFGKYTGTSTVNTVDVNADVANVNANSAAITSNELIIKDNPLFQVKPNTYNGVSSSYGIYSNVEIDPLKMQVSHVAADNTQNPILTVDYSSVVTDALPKDYRESVLSATGMNESVYIRHGAMEIEANLDEGGSYGADAGKGYVEASRFVSNALEFHTDEGPTLATPVYSGDYYKKDNSKKPIYGSRTEYDRYMVNPAYTSVMHDIKLTSRGGARLSDILPDFINKGIYVVTNTYRDNIDIKLIKPKYDTAAGGRQVTAEDIQDVSQNTTFINEDRWASPFLGIVPAPQCPPGHAKLMTLMPAGFQMAQATSEFTQQDARNPFEGDGVYKRLVIEPGMGNEQDLGYMDGTNTDKNSATATTKTAKISDGTSTTTIYYLGYDKPEDGDAIHTKPLYFQQSTWLRSMVIPQAMGIEGDCSNQSEGCGSNFVGWSAIIGFVYPGNQYKNIIAKVAGVNTDNVDEDLYYWNVFPVQTGTIEGYATVYCYFDRTNMLGSGNDGKYVDQYDQLNNFREGYKKADGTDNNLFNNADYLNRLDDPTLKYNDPW